MSVCAAPTRPTLARRGRPAGVSPPRGSAPARYRGRPPAAAGPGSAASSRSGWTQPIRPSCSSARTIPTTRKRTSSASVSCAASTEPGRRPSASASPTPTSISFSAPDPPPFRERRRFELGVVAGVRDQAHRLAEPERVGGVDAVALADGGDAGQPSGLVDEPRVERDRDLVALADRPRVLAQTLEQRREREHQRDHAGADGDRRDRREPACACRGGEADAEREQAATGASGRAGEIAAAQDLDRRPSRGAPGRPRGGGDDHARRRRSARSPAARRVPLPVRVRSAPRAVRRPAARRSARRARSRALPPEPPPASPRSPAGPRSGRVRSRARAARRARSAGAGRRRARRRRASSRRRPARRARTRSAARSRSPRPATAGSPRPSG